jgi:hypothetical protein
VNSEISASYICWLKSESASSSSDYPPWVFLYLPILLIYSYALYVLVCAKQILKKGIPVTFLHRVRTLDTSKNMLTIFSLYYAWAVCLAVLTSTVKYLWPALTFTFSTKAFLSLVILWMMENSEFEQTTSLPQDHYQKNSSFAGNLGRAAADSQLESDEGTDQSSILYDLNHALQHEVVTYATVGIQQCAAGSATAFAGGGGGRGTAEGSSGSNHSLHDLRQSLPSSRPAPIAPFPRTLTNTTTRSQLTATSHPPNPWDEYCSLQIIIPQDLFVIDNDHFQSLARGTMRDLQNALKTSSQTMTVPALKSILQTRFLHNDWTAAADHSASASVYASEIGGTGAGEGGNDLSRATISSGTMTADRPNSWNLNK